VLKKLAEENTSPGGCSYMNLDKVIQKARSFWNNVKVIYSRKCESVFMHLLFNLFLRLEKLMHLVNYDALCYFTLLWIIIVPNNFFWNSFISRMASAFGFELCGFMIVIEIAYIRCWRNIWIVIWSLLLSRSQVWFLLVSISVG
jgi:hypothetical protein